MAALLEQPGGLQLDNVEETELFEMDYAIRQSIRRSPDDPEQESLMKYILWTLKREDTIECVMILEQRHGLLTTLSKRIVHWLVHAFK